MNDKIAEPQPESLSLLSTIGSHALADPHVLYSALRERDPVHWDPYMHAWVVTGYSEVVTVLGNYSADRSPANDYLDSLGLSFFKPFAETMKRQMLFMDGERHSHLRGLCSIAFGLRKIEQLRAVIEDVANALIDRTITTGRMDIVADFAAPLPAIMTAQLMGVPAEDHQQLGQWVNDITEVHGNLQHHPNRVSEVMKSLEDFKSYVATKIGELATKPNDGLICSLMAAQIGGVHLSEEDVIANTIVMIIGGHETTTNLIASGMLTLLRNEEAFHQLRVHPEIITSATEELLRFESPVQYTARIAPANMELGGKSIRKGSKVIALLAAANRDPSRFTDPDRLDLLRAENRHLAFGWGSHFCFGAGLARAEGQIAINMLIKRLTNPILVDQKLHWRQNAGMRGLTKLILEFDPQFVYI